MSRSIATDLERHMLALVNAERRAAGLAPLVLDQTLNASAEQHSQWMLEVDVFSHTGEGGSSATQRMRDAGFDFSGSWASGENLAVQSARGAAGYLDDVENLHQSLMNSPGHRANILNTSFQVIGIGIEIGSFRFDQGYDLLSVMATQNFARTQGVTVPDPDPSALPSGGTAPPALTGTDGDDTLTGGAGDDVLDGGAGADLLIGGAGSDRYIVEDAGDRVEETSGGGGIDHVFSAVDFRMRQSHIENLTLTGQGDTRGLGNGLANVITGNAGDNILDGGKNNDTLVGGAGDDTYHVRAPGDIVVEAAGQGIDTVKAYRAYALPDHVENLFLQAMRNAAGEGVAGVNGIGNDLDNLIVGNPFDNVLAGRGGSDTLKGQGGADTFVFDRAPGPGNIDRIVDFTPGEDRLALKAGLFGLAVTEVTAAMLSDTRVAQDGADRILYDRVTGGVWIDPDGTGPARALLGFVLDGQPDLGPGDIFLF